MINKTLTVIIATALVMAGGTSAVILQFNIGDDKNVEINYDCATLMVYGNANNDLTIDDKDKTIIQEIIDGQKKRADCPFADVNGDGKIDEADLAAAQNIDVNDRTVIQEIIREIIDGKKELADYPFADVNGDGKVDEADLAAAQNTVVNDRTVIQEIIREIIDGKKELADYPFADVNCDGKVDEADLAAAQNIDVNDRTVIQEIIREIIDGKKELADYPFADVNGDGKVDEADLAAAQNTVVNDRTIIQEIIREIINGEKKRAECPFADANYDGVIDENDLIAVQKIIDREEGITLYVACYDYHNEKSVVKVRYPLRDIALFGMSAINSTLCASAGGSVIASANHAGGKDVYPIAMGSLGGESFSSGMGATSFDWRTFCEIADRDDVNIDAFILDTSYSSLLNEGLRIVVRQMKLPIIGFNGNDVYAQIWATALIGFLCGEETEKVGQKFASTSTEILDYVSEKISILPETEKKTLITLTRWISVCENDAPHNSLGILAGAVPYYETNTEFAKTFEGKSASGNLDAETLSNFQDSDAYISLTSVDFKTDFNKAAIDLFEFKNEQLGNIYVTDFMHGAKVRLAFVNNLLPTAIKVAYIAQVLYPELFGSDFGDKVAQRFIDEGYAPFAGLTVKQLDAMITYQDYRAAGGKQ